MIKTFRLFIHNDPEKRFCKWKLKRNFMQQIGTIGVATECCRTIVINFIRTYHIVEESFKDFKNLQPLGGNFLCSQRFMKLFRSFLLKFFHSSIFMCIFIEINCGQHSELNTNLIQMEFLEQHGAINGTTLTNFQPRVTLIQGRNWFRTSDLFTKFCCTQYRYFLGIFVVCG